MHTIPLSAQAIRHISEEAAYNAGKNPTISPSEVFPHVYEALNKHLGGSVASLADLVTPNPAPSPLEALQAARVALDNCVMVMSRDLAGLRSIQPELKCSREALAQVEAAIEQLKPVEPVSSELLDDLLKLNSKFPYDDKPISASDYEGLLARLRSTYTLEQINTACDTLDLARWQKLGV